MIKGRYPVVMLVIGAILGCQSDGKGDIWLMAGFALLAFWDMDNSKVPGRRGE